MKQVVAAALAVASLALAGRAAAEDDIATARRFLDAGRYTDAMYSLHAAADSGDAEAAETLALALYLRRRAIPRRRTQVPARFRCA